MKKKRPSRPIGVPTGWFTVINLELDLERGPLAPGDQKYENGPTTTI